MQNLGISAYGWTWQKRRFGGIFTQELRGFQEREGFSAQQWRDEQTLRLRQLLCHAFAQVPYYQKIFNSLGINASRLQKWELEDLHKLPLLPKNTLREQGSSGLLSHKREANGAFFSSSGSTGTPVKILFSHPMHQRWSAAYEARVRHWAGVTRHDPRGMIGGRRVVPDGEADPPFYRYNFVEKQTYFSAYHLSPTTISNYLEGLQKHPSKYLNGYAVSLFSLARLLEETGQEAPEMRAILPSSEPLTPGMRATFQRVFGCKTFDAWSGVEACGLVSECPQGRLHVSPDTAILEFLNPDSGLPARAGEMAEVVCTGLLNMDQPLIRYRIGDLMRISSESCPCGREMPVIQGITGRMEDKIIGPDGREMVRFHGIFLDIPGIVEGQIVQHGLADFEVKIVASQPLKTVDHQRIIQRMRSQLGPVGVRVSEVGHIPRGANGKFQAVISVIS